MRNKCLNLKDTKLIKGDMLQNIFRIQKKFGSKFCDFGTKNIKLKEKWTKEFILCCMSELSEILGWINWKHWKKQKYPINEKELKYEIIDLLHFVISLALINGMSAKELYQLYLNKNKENFDRQKRGY